MEPLKETGRTTVVNSEMIIVSNFSCMYLVEPQVHVVVPNYQLACVSRVIFQRVPMSQVGTDLIPFCFHGSLSPTSACYSFPLDI